MRVAFLGPRGTNSEEAALMYGGAGADLRAFSGFPALVEAVEMGKADVAVLPIENSIEGPVSAALDLLIHETDLKLCSEVVVPIRHMLVGAPGATLAGIRTVMSHPQALAQCRRFLERSLPGAEQVAWMSTGGAVEEVAKGADPSVAAIGPERAQQLYGGEMIARDIQDSQSNLTRFFVLAHEDAPPTGDDKTFVAFKCNANVPGSLYEVLGPFAKAGIQLTNIITRPTKGWLGEYVFLLDFDGHRKDPAVAKVLDEVRAIADELKVMGSCPRFPIEQFRELVSTPAAV
ncbi:MAG TPA: prephenate dehydratase [Thermomicrobiales bacterium]|nr:prephenate dehydratase [Thermomicrobiales bacterium]